MKLNIILVLAAIIAVSGCTDLGNKTHAAGLVGEVSDRTVTGESPGEIKLNAKNSGNETSFYVLVEPVGDYSKIVSITDRNEEATNRVNLGTAVKDATTGENFVQVRKDLNVTSSVKIKAELYSEDYNETLDTETYRLNTKED